MPAISTLADLLAAGAADRPAIRALERPPLSYAGLRALSERTLASLNAMGISRGDRVAIVLPNGPEMAAAFVAIAGAATTAAPSNRRFEQERFVKSINKINILIEHID